MRELIRVYPISPVGLLIHIRARGISHVSLCPFVFGWLHFQLEEESLFRLHPVVSGSFHWEHHTFNKAYYFSPPESLCSRRLLSCVGMLLKEVIDSKALVLTTQYYRFEIEKI